MRSGAGFGKAGSAPVQSGGGFAAPNLIVNSTFGTDFAGWGDGGVGLPSGGNLSRDATDHAPVAGCTGSLKRTWAPDTDDVAAQIFYDYASPQDRVNARFYFKISNTINTVQKLFRFYSPAGGSPIGGLYIGDAIDFNLDLENTAAQTAVVLDTGNIFDNVYHWLEIDYWRNGHPSGFPVATFWYDGLNVGMPDGAPTHNSDGDPHHWNWFTEGGLKKLSGGERNSSLQLQRQEVLGVINGGVATSGEEHMDRIAVSSLGRIGP